MTKSNTKIQYMCVAGVFAALVFIATGILPLRIPLPTGGYAHLGDIFVFLAATCLPQPYALAAAGIGAAAADVFAGYYTYVPFTLVIKAAITLLFCCRSPDARKGKLICPRNIAALGGALVITVGGYYLAEVIMYRSFASPLANIFGNAMQIIVDGAVFVIAALAVDKSGFLRRREN